MIRCVLIDDESYALDTMNELICEIQGVEITATANSAKNGLSAIIEHNPDLIFLDVEMPGGDGFSLVDSLRSLKKPPEVIFVTAYDHYAIEAIRYAAFDYLLKPVSADELEQCISRYTAKKLVNIGNQFDQLLNYVNTPRISFRSRTGSVFVDPQEVLCVQADGNYSEMLLTLDRKHLVSQYLSEVVEALRHPHFQKISRSAYVNVNFLDSIDRKKKVCRLRDGNKVIELAAVYKYLRKLEGI